MSLALAVLFLVFASLLAVLIHLQLDRDAQDFREALELATQDATRDLFAPARRAADAALERLAATSPSDPVTLRRVADELFLVDVPFHVRGGELVWPPRRAAQSPTELLSRPDMTSKQRQLERRAIERSQGTDRDLARRTFEELLLQERLPPQSFATDALLFAAFLAEEPDRLDEALSWCRRAARAAVDAGLPDLQLLARLRQVELLIAGERLAEAAKTAAETLTIAVRDDVFFRSGPASGFVIDRLWQHLRSPELRKLWPPELDVAKLRDRHRRLEREGAFAGELPAALRVELELLDASTKSEGMVLRWSNEPMAIYCWRPISPSNAASEPLDDGTIRRRPEPEPAAVGFRSSIEAWQPIWSEALQQAAATLPDPNAARLVSPTGRILATAGPRSALPDSGSLVTIEHMLGDAPLQIEVDFTDTIAAERRRRARGYGSLAAIALLVLAGGGWAVRLGIRRQLELAEARARFVTDVSHDLRTPLTQIRLFTDILREGYQRKPEDVEQSLGIIAREVDELELLIDNVLELARGEKRREAERTVEALGPVVERLVETRRPSLERRGFEVEVSVANGCPPVRIDRPKVEQAVRNLISNAVKYSREEKAIAVSVERQENGVAARVADRGPGLPEDAERLFDRFARGDAPGQAHVGGVGLGLSIVRQIAEEHGGHVRSEARPGGGTVFTLWLPAEEQR